jgi:hypothetical protein
LLIVYSDNILLNSEIFQLFDFINLKPHLVKNHNFKKFIELLPCALSKIFYNK